MPGGLNNSKSFNASGVSSHSQKLIATNTDTGLESRSSNDSMVATNPTAQAKEQNCDGDTMRVIQEALKSKLQINEINDVEID